jgi:hypothetical protein
VERKFEQKQEKIRYDSLSPEEKYVFLERAKYLIENQYVETADENELARKLYDANGRT